MTMLYADGDNIAAAVLSALNERDRDVREQVISVAARSADPELLVRAVADHTDAVRRNAALDALARGGARSVPALVRALEDDDPEVVMFAATVLGKTRDREAIPHLIRLLDHEDVNIVQAAIESLGHLRAGAAVPRLAQLLDHDPWLRFGAVHALGEIGDPRAVGALASALDDSDVWELVVSALGKLRSPDAIGHLADALATRADSPQFDVPLRALGDALRRQPRPEALTAIAAWTRLADPADGASVHERLRAIFERAADGASAELELAESAAMIVRALGLRPLYLPLVRAARRPALRPTLQVWAIAAGEAIADALADSIGDGDAGVRALVCRAAGVLRLRSLIDAVAGRVADTDAGVREAAVRALMQLGPDTAVPGLTECLVDPDPLVRTAAQQALAACDPALSSEALLASPRRDDAVVSAMLRVMQARPHGDQLPFLFDCLRHDQPAIRALAVDALAEQAEIDLVGIVTPVLDDPADEVRAATVRVLGRKRAARAIDVLLERLDKGASDFRLVVKTLLAMDGAVIAPRLVEIYLRHPDRDHAPILEALAALRDPAVEPLLFALLADDAIDQRRFAVTALAGYGTAVSRQHLIAAGTDPAPEVRAAVAEALGELRHPDAIAELERLCFDENRAVATAARHRLESLHVD
jgi:HEAT repeat protein